MSRFTVATPKGGPSDDGDDESRRKRDLDLMDKANDEDKVMEEAEKEIEIQDSTPPKQSEPAQ